MVAKKGTSRYLAIWAAEGANIAWGCCSACLFHSPPPNVDTPLELRFCAREVFESF